MNDNDLHKFEQELIENDSFILWVKSEFEEDNDYWSDFIDNNEGQIDNINRAINTVRSLNFSDVSDLNTVSLWQRIEKNTISESQTPARPKRMIIVRRLVMGLAAACAASLMIFYFTFNNTVKNIHTGPGEEILVALPDGSSVLLSSNSSIKYFPGVWKDHRDVHLEGLAYFEVEKGNEFSVITSLGIVKVLGTSFSVNARSRHFEVICKTGKVSVSAINNNEGSILLMPGDKVTSKNGNFEFIQATKDVFNEITWLNGVYTFENELLKDVTAELENQFGIKVIIDEALKEIKYTGYFHKGDLKNALYSVTWPLQLKYSVDGNKVEIFK